MAAGEGTPVTDRSLRYELAEGPGVMAQCRALTRQALHAWFGPAGAPDREPAGDALLLVSEVVTNARRHGRGPYELRLDGSERALWVQVSDTSPERPRRRAPHRAARCSGHGLYLLQRLAARWGSVPRGDAGKTVWFEVVVVPEAPHHRPA
ncbi:ATP-binding protein [Streptomyces sp. NPDC048018]|uniref:ATP-binding protein n=1 Tax=Streptomyces sp. NPDC048018 TaxID=3365499 RepID=UPI003718A6EE